ncbi:hypothetical protein, partial [Aeromonas veronii]|uniref:hypothetical protein n=1 Tax=Aeromonas veronii TaxID=654 RepID=UPI003D235BC9
VNQIKFLEAIATYSDGSQSNVSDTAHWVSTDDLIVAFNLEAWGVISLNDDAIGFLGNGLGVAAIRASIAGVMSEPFDIKVVNGFGSVNGGKDFAFSINDGFPTTVYPGAKFRLYLLSGDPRDYTWTSDDLSTLVDIDGTVYVSEPKAGAPVTISARSKLEPNEVITYTYRIGKEFKLSSWLTDKESAINLCSGEYTLATMKDIAHFISYSDVLRNKKIVAQPAVGALWSEWGREPFWEGIGLNPDFWVLDRIPDVDNEDGQSFTISGEMIEPIEIDDPDYYVYGSVRQSNHMAAAVCVRQF